MLKKIFKFGSNKDDVIEIWSRFPGLADVEPPKESKYFLPKWWTTAQKWQSEDVKKNNIRDNITNKGTIKRCPAVPEFMSMGITIPMWCDMQVEIFDDGSWKWNTPSNQFEMSSHGNGQLKDLLPKNVQPEIVLKTECPWLIKTPPGISMLQLPMMWHFSTVFTTAPGVIWTDIHHEINQQLFFKKRGKHMITRGTPIAQYIPIRRESWDYNVNKIVPDELKYAADQSTLQVRTKFGSGYQMHQIDTVKECPYHAAKK